MHEGWIAAIGTAVVALIGAVFAGWKVVSTTRHAQRKEDQATALGEYRTLVEELRTHQREQDERQAEDKRILSERMLRLEEENKKCREDKTVMASENTEFRTTIKYLERDIRALQANAGTLPPSSSMPVVVTASLDGTIIEASPSTSQMFHWTSTELVGKSVEVLIPERYLAAHRAGMEKIKKDGPGDLITGEPKMVVGFGKDRSGEEVPVVIFLTAWQDEHQKWMVSAEIVRRRGRPKSGVGGDRPGDARFRIDDGSKEMRALK